MLINTTIISHAFEFGPISWATSYGYLVQKMRYSAQCQPRTKSAFCFQIFCSPSRMQIDSTPLLDCAMHAQQLQGQFDNIVARRLMCKKKEKKLITSTRWRDKLEEVPKAEEH